ncbi:hypothetical protein B0H14DRAFT_2557315 [Mycena olivaceomarginata]|nr:hypothetical protein B0H14DRAFT_2557315 [Mycena olivaceomarginata]
MCKLRVWTAPNLGQEHPITLRYTSEMRSTIHRSRQAIDAVEWWLRELELPKAHAVKKQRSLRCDSPANPGRSPAFGDGCAIVDIHVVSAMSTLRMGESSGRSECCQLRCVRGDSAMSFIGSKSGPLSGDGSDDTDGQIESGETRR